jgi:hypothetical protein
VASDHQRNYVRFGIRRSSRLFGTLIKRIGMVMRLAFGVLMEHVC